VGNCLIQYVAAALDSLLPPLIDRLPLRRNTDGLGSGGLLNEVVRGSDLGLLEETPQRQLG
jgi:hypothetical protein